MGDRKYPRTWHLPDSPGATADDRRLTELTGLTGELVVTEKMDGGNVTFTRHRMYARSLDSGTHSWDHACKAMWARVAHDIPPRWRISGESMWARRSVAYHDLPGPYLVFGVWDADHVLQGWDETVEWAALLDLPVVPLLYRGSDLAEAKSAWSRQRDEEHSEGYVLRYAGLIPEADFDHRVGKWVRPSHVRTTAAWRHRDDFAVNTFRAAP